MRKLRYAAGAMAAVIALQGCAVSAGLPEGGGTTADPTVSAPAPRDEPKPSTAVPETSPDVAGKTFEEDVDLARETVEEYWREEFPKRGLGFEPVARMIPYRGKGGPKCGSERIPANNAVYCSGADYIAWDTDWLRKTWRDIGDAFVYFVIGHEYGHAIQARLGLSSSFSIKTELQADCLAGAYLGDVTNSGRLTREKGDFEELFRGMSEVADEPGVGWFDSGAHGSASQRRAAFFAGYLTTPKACTTKL
ncbi:neutral zinc metallopeptidase [Phytohabitans sp. LJ34]|uniref:neutral zinc metallopeptidase n=1 Tax=Phytohabitans sp. LJ34 TaxID=3452217 RepID=UPI003F8C022E